MVKPLLPAGVFFAGADLGSCVVHNRLSQSVMGLVGTMSVVYPGCMHLFGYLIVIAVAYAATAAADVYRSKDADGNVIYSDEAGPGAEKVEARDPTILPAEPLPSRTSASKTPNPKQSAKPYESVSITRPANEQTIRDNVANINVAISVRPPLQVGFGHRLQLLFDGQGVGPPGRKLSFTLPNVDRGAHTLEAVVLDPNGPVKARSPITTFFVHKHSVRRGAQ